MEKTTQLILQNSELKITNIDTIEGRVTFTISKSIGRDFEGYTFKLYMSKEELQSSKTIFELGRKKISQLAVKFFEQGYPFIGQTSKAW